MVEVKAAVPSSQDSIFGTASEAAPIRASLVLDGEFKAFSFVPFPVAQRLLSDGPGRGEVKRETCAAGPLITEISGQCEV